MKNLISGTIYLCVVLVLAGCATMEEPTAEEILTGTWKSEGSVAVYKIEVSDGSVQMSGHSSLSGKLLQLSHVSWDGQVLRFTSYLASTNMKVVHENRIKDSKTMVSQTVENKTGQPRTHTVVWKKQPPKK